MADQGREQDPFNTEIRKFLKTVGVTSQQEIESARRRAQQAGRAGGGPLAARMTLEIPELGLTHVVEQQLKLE